MYGYHIAWRDSKISLEGRTGLKCIFSGIIGSAIAVALLLVGPVKAACLSLGLVLASMFLLLLETKWSLKSLIAVVLNLAAMFLCGMVIAF